MEVTALISGSSLLLAHKKIGGGGGGEERGTGNEVWQLGLLRFEFSAFCFDQPGRTFSLFLDRLALIASPR